VKERPIEHVAAVARLVAERDAANRRAVDAEQQLSWKTSGSDALLVAIRDALEAQKWSESRSILEAAMEGRCRWCDEPLSECHCDDAIRPSPPKLTRHEIETTLRRSVDNARALDTAIAPVFRAPDALADARRAERGVADEVRELEEDDE
jgi:hypothetical protein